jgi:hypothetical protein
MHPLRQGNLARMGREPELKALPSSRNGASDTVTFA